MRRVGWTGRGFAVLAAALVVALTLAACGGAEPTATPTRAAATPTLVPPTVELRLTVYSGRSKTLVQPAIDAFSAASGIRVGVRYGDTAEIAATVLEEGKNSPADVVFLQDAGALGALSQAAVLAPLPQELLDRVDRKFRSPKGEWVGTSGRVRTVVYNKSRVDPQRDLPDSVLGFADPKWRGRIGWAPTNGSFQAFVTALRLLQGEEGARRWLEGMKANKPVAYANNTAIVLATATGEVDVGFTNHYYLYQQLKAKGPGFGAANYYIGKGDAGALVNVAGVGILKTAEHQQAAQRFVAYMLSQQGQEYFARETFEYPLVSGLPQPQGAPSLAELQPPAIDLGNLADLQGTLKLLREVGILP